MFPLPPLGWDGGREVWGTSMDHWGVGGGGAVVDVIAYAAIVFVVVVDDGASINGCIASASAPVVHVLPGQG